MEPQNAKYTDAELLTITHKQMRKEFCGLNVVSKINDKSGRIVEVEIKKEILDLKAANLLEIYSTIVCHIWSGNELWSALASELQFNKLTTQPKTH